MGRPSPLAEIRQHTPQLPCAERLGIGWRFLQRLYCFVRYQIHGSPIRRGLTRVDLGEIRRCLRDAHVHAGVEPFDGLCQPEDRAMDSADLLLALGIGEYACEVQALDAEEQLV